MRYSAFFSLNIDEPGGTVRLMRLSDNTLRRKVQL